MQTFLPYENFEESAKSLDRARLGKQRVETLQILNALQNRKEGIQKGWVNHPAVIMWENAELSLCEYGIAICREWVGRGYKDTCLGKIEQKAQTIGGESWREFATPPTWLGDDSFHRSHRSKLYQKKPEYYSQWADVPVLEYIWKKNE